MGILGELSFQVQEELIIALTVVLYAVARLIGVIAKRVELGENIVISLKGVTIAKLERDTHPIRQVKGKIQATKE
jgi:hypothetical protein